MQVIEKLNAIAKKIYDDLTRNEIPCLSIPTRAKSNIRFDSKFSVWKYGSSKSLRSAKTLDGAYMLLRTMYVADFIKKMIETRKSSTLREMYYISEGWGLAKFNSQQESDSLA
ncbi:MAG: DNA topoisomerase VI, partial [Thermoplasmata archaeon]